MRRDQYYVDDENDIAELVKGYTYLITRDCRWLSGLPGVDRQRLRDVYERQQRREIHGLDAILAAVRKPVLTPSFTVTEQARAA